MASYASKITEETARLREGKPDLLGHVIKEYLEHVDGKPDRLLLYVDQWEELYAQATTGGSEDRAALQRKDVDQFIDLLLHATRFARVTIVATVRADFYELFGPSPATANGIARPTGKPYIDAALRVARFDNRTGEDGWLGV